jgi:hypothetical protein
MKISLNDYGFSRVRENRIVHGAPFGHLPSYWVSPAPPRAQFDEPHFRTGPFSDPASIPQYEQWEASETRDVPRKYRAKIKIFKDDKHYFELWPVIPFYTRKTGRRLERAANLEYRVLPRTSCPNCAKHGGMYADAYHYYASASDDSWKIHPWAGCPDPSNHGQISGYAPVPEIPEVSGFEDWCSSGILNPALDRVLNRLDEWLSGEMPDMLVQCWEATEMDDLVKLPKSVADAQLYASLGLRPTLETSVELHGVLSTSIRMAKDRLIRLRKQLRNRVLFPSLSGKYYVPRKYTVQTRTNTTSEWCVASTGVCEKRGYWSRDQYSEGSVKVGLRFAIEMPAVNGLLSEVDSMLETLNGLGDLSSIWQTISLTWLIDMFWNLKNMFKRLNLALKLGKHSRISIYDGWVVFERTYVDEVTDYPFPCFASKALMRGWSKEKLRIPFREDMLRGLPNLTLPKSLSQIATVVALVWTRTRS